MTVSPVSTLSTSFSPTGPANTAPAVSAPAPDYPALAIHSVHPAPGTGPRPRAAGESLVVDEANGNSPYAVTTDDTFAQVTVGNSSAGTLNHSAGNLTVTGVLNVGANSGGHGTYNLGGNGTLATAESDIGVNGQGTFEQTGGSHITGVFNVGTGSTGSGTYELMGGSLSTGPATIGVGGGAIFRQFGGTFTTNGNTLTLAAQGTLGTFALLGGTLTTGRVAGGNGESSFDFDGGTLRASASDAPHAANNPTTFFGAVTFASVNTGGAKIDTDGHDVTVAAELSHEGSFLSPPDGGLTKLGEGVLTLTGANGYTGPTNLTGGTLNVGSANALAGTNVLSFTGGTLQYSAANTADYSARLSTAANQQYRIDTNGQSVTFATALASTNGSLVKTGAGTLTVSGLNNFADPGTNQPLNPLGGTVTVLGGTLAAGVDNNAFGVNTAVVLANTAGVSLSLNEHNETLGSLSGGGANGGNVLLDDGNLTVGTDNTSPAAYGGGISGFGNVTKVGTGVLTLSGTSTYFGLTNVNAGTLALNGSISSFGLVTVARGATLTGSGSFAGNVSVQAGGTLIPGANGTGRLTASGVLELASPATVEFNLAGATAGSGYTQMDVGLLLTLDGTTLDVTVSDGFKLTLGEKFYLFDRTGTDTSATGTFGNAVGNVYTDARGDTYAVNYADSDPANGDGLANDISLTVLSVVPEPGTWAMWCVGAGVLVFSIHRRRRAV